MLAIAIWTAADIRTTALAAAVSYYIGTQQVPLFKRILRPKPIATKRPNKPPHRVTRITIRIAQAAEALAQIAGQNNILAPCANR